MEDLDSIESGINKAFVVKFKDGTKGIFKPKFGEQNSLRWMLTDKGDDGFLYTREVMAFNLDDQFLKWNIVPETVERTVNGKIGSLQKWITEKNVTVANDVNRISVLDTFRKTQDAEKMYLFDVLIGNADRHSGNYLINNSTFKGFAIDNGNSFRETTKLANPVWFKLRPDIPRSLNVSKVTEKLLNDITKLAVFSMGVQGINYIGIYESRFLYIRN